MKKTILFFLFVSALIHAQTTNRFFYEYQFIPNSNDKTDVKKEMMLLDIDGNGSNYYSRDKFVADSTTKADIERQMKSSPGSININKREKPGQVSYKVTKKYPDFTTYLFRSISMDQYKIKEDKKPEWKILPDKEKIGEYNTQKATTQLGGREWTAWFTADIPFQDGPYKFYGLPGLIVKIEDATGSHTMTLIGNKKMPDLTKEKEMQIPEGMRMIGMGGKEIEVTKDQFRKAWKAYVNDPTKNMREMMMRNGGDSNNKVVFKTKTADGKEISDPNQVFREIEKKTKETLSKNNNPIELDLEN
ncbi:GLPGLI family protein [Chryseobacterium sp. T16E-39]|uniref:GLPGLI family protein n=1 Tax=Chryseobacterium sp. T16E-39 TaxID=2015076 RepID=UPI000B5B2337|nr:GLPGLI family protein [Chryseobacterium sp. T16E-39]ASK29588.1 GLPGLI family protein [Chryseobacterium sp. T16E-39]